MTSAEAKLLKKGDYILYHGLRYKVLHIKEQRDYHEDETYILVKCRRKNETTWFIDSFIERED